MRVERGDQKTLSPALSRKRERGSYAGIVRPARIESAEAGVGVTILGLMRNPHPGFR